VARTSNAQVEKIRRKNGSFAAPSENGEGRNRTGDTTIFSRVLYQLSYLAARGDGSGASAH
jgi:hypothetical protein